MPKINHFIQIHEDQLHQILAKNPMQKCEISSFLLPNKGISKSIFEIPPPHQILVLNTQSKHTVRVKSTMKFFKSLPTNS